MAQTTAINTELLTTYLIKKFVPALEYELQMQKFCQRATIPNMSGKTARWNTFANAGASAAEALTEGTATEHSVDIATTGVEGIIAEFGEFTKVNNLLELTAQPNTRSELADRMGYGGALTLDTIVRDGESTVTMTGAIDATIDFYCNTSSGGGVATAATPLAGSAAAIIGAAKLLRDNAARGFSGISGHPDGHFAAIVGPQFELDMVTEESTDRMTWAKAVTNVAGNMGQTKWVNGYMGSVYGTAVYRTQNLTQTTVTVSADNNYLIADNALGCLDLGDADPQIYINTASAGDIGNPYRNANTVAWHAYFAAALIDANRIVRIYSAA